MDLTDLQGRTTITVVEAAKVLGVGQGRAYELARRGELPGALRLGRRWVVATATLLRALDVNGDGTHEEARKTEADLKALRNRVRSLAGEHRQLVRKLDEVVEDIERLRTLNEP